MEKTSVFNLIILDESGSMSSCEKATISGCNETLNVARQLQAKHTDSIRSFTSIYAFQSDGPVPSRYLCKNASTADVKNITDKDYQPYGCTPLLDAIGSTLVDLKAVASTHVDPSVTVTIITDGYENSSRQYTWQNVHQLISQLKELGWTFNFIGANIDVEEMGNKLNIDNRMAFSSDEEGTRQMFANYNERAMEFEEERIMAEHPDMAFEEKVAYRKKHARRFFKK